MESIISEIFGSFTFTPLEEKHILQHLKKLKLKAKKFLLLEGDSVDSLYYIQNGCLRSYFIDTQGKEHTLQFAISGWWISDYISLYGKKDSKSVFYIECIKNATLLKIRKQDFDTLCNTYSQISQLHIQNLQSAFASFQMRILDNLTLSAKERYIKFVNMYPDIETNVKNYHIASFLGITTESLSRVRKEIPKA